MPACTTDPLTGQQSLNKAAIGSLIGAAAGAGIGALSGDDSKERRQRALIGAGIGALGGGAIGSYMDRQEALLRDQLRDTGVSVTRRGQDIILNMPGNVTFATNSAQVESEFYSVLTSVAEVLKEYRQTLVDVAGHTDSTGSRAYNMTLSQRRATSVADYLRNQGVFASRFHVNGYGPDYPIADNGTEAGKQANRRVEITLQPLEQQ